MTWVLTQTGYYYYNVVGHLNFFQTPLHNKHHYTTNTTTQQTPLHNRHYYRTNTTTQQTSLHNKHHYRTNTTTEQTSLHNKHHYRTNTTTLLVLQNYQFITLFSIFVCYNASYVNIIYDSWIQIYLILYVIIIFCVLYEYIYFLHRNSYFFYQHELIFYWDLFSIYDILNIQKFRQIWKKCTADGVGW